MAPGKLTPSTLVSRLSALHRMSPVFCLMLASDVCKPILLPTLEWAGVTALKERQRIHPLERLARAMTSQMITGGSESRAPAQSLGSLGASTQIPCHPVSK